MISSSSNLFQSNSLQERGYGTCTHWVYKGIHYMRNEYNDVWECECSKYKCGEAWMGKWIGIYLPGEDRIDTTVAEPDYEDVPPPLISGSDDECHRDMCDCVTHGGSDDEYHHDMCDCVTHGG